MPLPFNCSDCGVWDSKRRRPLHELLGPRCPFPKFSSRFTMARTQYLYHQGDLPKGIFSLATGMVAIERLDPDGSLSILRILQPGALFPCATLLSEAAHDTAARALTDISGCFVATERLTAALRDTPEIGLALLKLSAAEIKENEETIFRLHSSTLADRLLATLTILAEEIGQQESNGDLSLTLPISWMDMAAVVGTRSEVISRLLRRLSDEGRLSFRGRKVTLLAEPHCRIATVGG